MAEIIHTHDTATDDGPSAVAIALAILVIALLLLGAWWLFLSDTSPIRENTTVITPNTAPGGNDTDVNIQQDGTGGGTGTEGQGGTDGSTGGSGSTTTSP